MGKELKGEMTSFGKHICPNTRMFGSCLCLILLFISCTTLDVCSRLGVEPIVLHHREISLLDFTHTHSACVCVCVSTVSAAQSTIPYKIISVISTDTQLLSMDRPAPPTAPPPALCSWRKGLACPRQPPPSQESGGGLRRRS